MIKVSHLTKNYGNHVAVDDISLDIKPGKIYGFLGPNGAGKSTTMNIITGYLAPTSGEVLIDGHDIYKEPEEAKACIGYLPEIPPLYVDMKVSEYLKFVCELKKVKKEDRDKEVERVMNLTKVSDVQNRIINNLSKGYRQRVGMAQALIGSPKVIILDEPTVGLDPNQIKEVRDLIKSLAGDHTVILSSHILSEISETCSHVFIIDKGKILANNAIETLSNYFNSKQVLEIVAKDKCKEIIEAIEDIESVSVEKGTEEGTVNITVTATYSKDVREDVSLALSSEKISIFEMKEDTKSLEDVFLELTAKEEE